MAMNWFDFALQKHLTIALPEYSFSDPKKAEKFQEHVNLLWW